MWYQVLKLSITVDVRCKSEVLEHKLEGKGKGKGRLERTIGLSFEPQDKGRAV